MKIGNASANSNGFGSIEKVKSPLNRVSNINPYFCDRSLYNNYERIRDYEWNEYGWH